EVHGLESPMKKVATGRAFAGVLPVYVQQKAVIGADVNPEVGWHRGHRDLFAEIEHPRIPLGCVRTCDPCRRPVRSAKSGIQWTHDLRLGSECDDGKQAAERVPPMGEHHLSFYGRRVFQDSSPRGPVGAALAESPASSCNLGVSESTALNRGYLLARLHSFPFYVAASFLPLALA